MFFSNSAHIADYLLCLHIVLGLCTPIGGYSVCMSSLCIKCGVRLVLLGKFMPMIAGGEHEAQWYWLSAVVCVYPTIFIFLLYDVTSEWLFPAMYLTRKETSPCFLFNSHI